MCFLKLDLFGGKGILHEIFWLVKASLFEHNNEKTLVLYYRDLRPKVIVKKVMSLP
jgi:hypothetical protein